MTTEALVADIVSAYVTKNTVGVGELPALIRSVHTALASLGKPEVEPEAVLTPAVPIKKSVHPDYIVCLEDGNARRQLRWPVQRQL